MVFNGSPRGEKSNSNIISSWFVNGFESHEKVFLSKVKQHSDFIAKAKDFDKFLFVMPLYVDGMPGQVKYFFELMNANKDVFKGKEISFILHSGFSEAVHSKNLEKYFVRLSAILEMNYYGTLIMPGSEGFRLMPEKMTAKKAEMVSKIGRDWSTDTDFDVAVKNKLQGPLVKSKPQLLLFKIFKVFGFTNMYWNSQLKKNGAYDNRFDAPYKK
jgi:multimeric flavodoxin WrbA